MSLRSWKKEFYGSVTRSTSSWLKACEHSLRKWEGATKPNMKKHELIWSGEGVVEKANGRYHWDVPALEFNDDTCALCQRADKIIEKANGADRCSVCPLVAIQGGIDCRESNSPFGVYYHTGRPAKMIKALRKLHNELSKTK